MIAVSSRRAKREPILIDGKPIHGRAIQQLIWLSA